MEGSQTPERRNAAPEGQERRTTAQPEGNGSRSVEVTGIFAGINRALEQVSRWFESGQVRDPSLGAERRETPPSVETAGRTLPAQPGQPPEAVITAQPGRPPEGAVPEQRGKTLTEKVGEGFQKLVELFNRFMRSIQAMGASTLRGMATLLRMVGANRPAEFLDQMAGADFAELTEALGKSPPITLVKPQLNESDPASRTAVETYERALTDLASRYQALAQTRGAGYRRAQYYGEVVQAWRTQNPGKTQCKAEDLQAMVQIANALPATVAAAPQTTPVSLEAGVDVTTATLTINSISVSRVEHGRERLLKVGGKKFCVKLGPLIADVVKVEQMSDQSLRITGSLLAAGVSAGAGTIRVEQGECNQVISALNSLTTSSTTLSVSYLDENRNRKTQSLTFELVP